MKSALWTIFRVGTAILFVASICATAQEGKATKPIADFVQRGDSGLELVVSDETGAVIQGANISIDQTMTGTRLEGKTDQAGAFRAADLASGLYTICARARGFKIVKTSVDLGPRDTQRIAVRLPVDSTPTDGPLFSGVETQISTLDYKFLREPSPSAAPEKPPAQNPKRSSLRRFLSALGRRLGF